MRGGCVTPTQVETLERIAWHGNQWWHDLPHPTRNVLLRERWIAHAHGSCVTHDKRHPGYVTITPRGVRALARVGSYIGIALERVTGKR